MKKFLLFSFAFLLMCSFASQAQTYRAVLSFGSIGMGVPGDEPLVAYINKFKKQQKVKSIKADQIGPFGREGEYKLCFKLTELTAKKRTLFISGLKKTIAGMKENSGYVHLSQNEIVEVPFNRGTKQSRVF